MGATLRLCGCWNASKRLADQLLWRQCCCGCQQCIWLPEHCQGQGQRHESKLTVCTCGVDNEDRAASSKLHSTLSRWSPKMCTWLSVNQSPPPNDPPAFLVSLSKCMNINPGKLIAVASESHILVKKKCLFYACESLISAESSVFFHSECTFASMTAGNRSLLTCLHSLFIVPPLDSLFLQPCFLSKSSVIRSRCGDAGTFWEVCCSLSNLVQEWMSAFPLVVGQSVRDSFICFAAGLGVPKSIIIMLSALCWSTYLHTVHHSLIMCGKQNNRMTQMKSVKQTEPQTTSRSDKCPAMSLVNLIGFGSLLWLWIQKYK